MCSRAVKPKPFSELFSSKACPGGGLPKLPRETGIYAGTFGDVNGFLDAGACRTFGGV